MSDWKLINEFLEVKNEWLTLKGEHWIDEKKKTLEYWRIEKNDSVIVLPLRAGSIVCPKPTFRVGVQRSTYDFPGGRLPSDKQPGDVVSAILGNELNLPAESIQSVSALNESKWIVNSSFSNQGVWGFVAEIDENTPISKSSIGLTVSANERGIFELLSRLDCLQCRMVLLEWKNQHLNGLQESWQKPEDT